MQTSDLITQLIARRKELGYTQTQLAEKLGVAKLLSFGNPNLLQ